MCELKSQVCELEEELASAMDELCLTQDAVTHTKEQLQKLVVEQDKMVHCGKKVEDVSNTKGESLQSLKVMLRVHCELPSNLGSSLIQ